MLSAALLGPYYILLNEGDNQPISSWPVDILGDEAKQPQHVSTELQRDHRVSPRTDHHVSPRAVASLPPGAPEDQVQIDAQVLLLELDNAGKMGSKNLYLTSLLI